ncbi:MAG TPA: hypothetical protein VF189_05160 [Patescibacteria group bacterium]
MPIEFLHDSILRFMHAANKVALYAPFWILITAIPFLFGFGNFLLILFNFKLLSILFYFATVLLIWKMTKSLYKTAFFALNPLVIIETLISGHNDISMISLLLLAIYFLQEKKFGKGAIFYIFSAGIKYATLILLPLIPIALVKKWDTKKLFTWITILMAIIFVLSSFREEIYPWYGQWVILPGTFLIDNKLIKYILVGLSFGLLLRYIPFMLLGTYFGPTPILKLILMTIPILVAFFFYTIKKQKMYEGH